ncbi:MAG: hypothetical protein ACRD0K_18520 [Egibacteraceae bacterium]
MSASTTAPDVHTSAEDYDPQRPYRDYDSSTLLEETERQYDQGERFNELIVFELIHRLGAAEMALRDARRTA